MQEPFLFKAPARLIDFMRQADQPGLINLAAGVPGLDALPAEALEKAFQTAVEKRGNSLFAYHHPEGDGVLRDLLAGRLRERGVQGLTGSEIVTTTGCTQALQVMLSVLVEPGGIVACEAPAYYGLVELIAAMGARVLPIPVRSGEGMDLKEVRELLTRWKPQCIVVCTSLSNPSGATMSQSAREELVAICRETGVRLLEDDIYSELLDEGATPPCRAFDDGGTVSFVTSFSKSVSPGLRIGYCIPGTPELHDAFATKKCQQDLHSSVITEGILREFLAAGALDPHLEWLRERNQKRRALVQTAIEQHFPSATRVLTPAGGYMLWAELPPGTDLPRLRSDALAQGVAFAAGGVFYPSAELPGATHSIRLNCAKADESDLEKGIAVIGSLIREQLA